MAALDANTPAKLDGSVSTDEGDLQIEIMQVCKANAATLSTSHEATGADGVGRGGGRGPYCVLETMSAIGLSCVQEKRHWTGWFAI